MKFLKLTKSSGDKNVWVNMEIIIQFWRVEEVSAGRRDTDAYTSLCSTVEPTSGNIINVKETPEEIMRLLSGTPRD